MKSYEAGKYILHKGYKPFLPSFINDDIDWKLGELSNLIQEASLWLGKLNSYSDLIPDIDFFIKMYATKEATNSNRIEGTRTTFDDAISPIEQVKPEFRDDWHEVQNYLAAINYSIEKLSELPISIRLIKEAHQRLLSGVRGEHKAPGEVRKTQNWIGGSSLKDAFFIPPEPNMLPELLTDIEKFLHNEELEIPEIVKAGIVHYQFETIHPFLDGNGRIGRILIILYLISRKKLKYPCLYLSYYLKKNQFEYYERMSIVRKNNDYIQWINFFLKGIIEMSKDSIECILILTTLRNEFKKLIKPSDYWLLEYLETTPIIDAKTTSTILNLDYSKVNRTIIRFVDLGILKITNTSKRNRTYIYEQYLNVLKN